VEVTEVVYDGGMRFGLSCLLLVVLSACGPRELKVTMNSDNNSGQTGFAVLTDRGGQKMTVTVETSAPDYAEKPQNAHIHEGNCGEVGIVHVGLTPLDALTDKPGRFGSTTSIDTMGFGDLATGSWIINVHDARDVGIYVSCGEIPRP
jgi:hypothetical protein